MPPKGPDLEGTVGRAPNLHTLSRGWISNRGGRLLGTIPSFTISVVLDGETTVHEVQFRPQTMLVSTGQEAIIDGIIVSAPFEHFTAKLSLIGSPTLELWGGRFRGYRPPLL
jgi:hypothetical protein